MRVIRCARTFRLDLKRETGLFPKRGHRCKLGWGWVNFCGGAWVTRTRKWPFADFFVSLSYQPSRVSFVVFFV